MTMRVLVTGGLGFIGGHLAEGLLRHPDIHVTVVDDLSGAAPHAANDFLSNWGRTGRVPIDLVTCSVEDYCRSAADDFDVIYHLASIVGPAAVLRQAGQIAESILRDTYHMIRLAQRCGARLVNVSTSEIYGGGSGGYCHEETPRVIRGPASARQEYAAAKLAAEVALENFSRSGRLDAVTVRPFNVSGTRQSGRGGFVLPRFVGQALLELPLTVFGNGRQVRAFTDARDVADGLMLLAERGVAGTAYNVGNPANRITILDLARRVLDLSGSPSSIKHVDPREIHGPAYAEAPDKFPDARRLMQLGWRPRFPLEETIRAVLGHMRLLDITALRQLAGLDRAPCDQTTEMVSRTSGLSAVMETLPAARSLS